MKTFEYKITNELGIHARPAGMLVNKAKSLDSEITLEKFGKSVDATKLFAVMTLGVKKNDIVNVNVVGGNEENSVTELQNFFRENL